MISQTAKENINIIFNFVIGNNNDKTKKTAPMKMLFRKY